MQVIDPSQEVIQVRINEDIAKVIAKALPGDVRIVYDNAGNAFIAGAPKVIEALLAANNFGFTPLNIAEWKADARIKTSAMSTPDSGQDADAGRGKNHIATLDNGTMLDKLHTVPLDDHKSQFLFDQRKTDVAPFKTSSDVNHAPQWIGSSLTIDLTQDLAYQLAPRTWFHDPEGQPIQLTFSVDGYSTLPGWLSYDPVTGLFSGKPGNDDVGQYTLRITYSDGVRSNSVAITVNIHNVNDTPIAAVDTDNAPNAVAENAAIGTYVGVTAQGHDIDVGTILTYSLVDDAGGRFAIDSLTGVITVANSSLLDYETMASHTVTVRTSDGELFSDSTFTIHLTDVNEAPVLTGAAYTVAENTAGVVWLGALGLVDVDAGDTHTWSILSGNDDGLFTVSHGQVILIAPPNYEATNVYTLTVQVTDSGGLTDTATVTINITDVNETPTAGTFTFSHAENHAPGILGALSATDPDAGDTLSWSIVGGNGGGLFALTADGELSVIGVLDYEDAAAHTLTVRVTDAQGLYHDTTVTINVTDVNEAPLAIDDTYAVNENAVIGTVVANLLAADPDAGDTHTWSILSGNGGGIFALAADGTLTIATPPNYEATNTYTLTVQVTDSGGLTDTATITININDVNEAPTATGATYTVVENTVSGTVLGTLTATDPDAGDSVTWSIVGGNGDGVFAISAGGVLTIASPPDYERTSTHTLTVRATDSGGLHHDVTVTVNVTDVSDAPSDIFLSSYSVDENSAIGTIIGTLSALDDIGDTHTFQLVADPDGKFLLDGNVLKVNGLLNHETFSSHNVTIRVSDGTYTFTKTLTIHINDINDIPVVANQSFHVAENSAAGTLVTRVSGTAPLHAVRGFDEDGDTLTYTITSGNGAGLFEIDSLTGEIRVAPGAVLDFEGTNSFTLGVTAHDGAASSVEGFITITLTNVNEAPDPADATITLYSGTAGGTHFSTLMPNDPDAGDTHSWSIVAGNTHNLFSIDANGRLLLNDLPSNYGDMLYTLTVQSTDAGGLSGTATITVNISDINNPPVITAPASQNGVEDVSLVLGGISFSDLDAGQIYSLTINAGTGTLHLNTGVHGGVGVGNITGNGTGTLTISGVTLAQLNATFAASGLSYHMGANAHGSTTLTYTISDGGHTDIHTQAVNIASVNDAPVANLSLPVHSIESDQLWHYTFPANTFVDVDGDALTYTATLSSGNPLPGFISFDPVSRTFSVSSIPGEPNIGSYNIRITANDGNGGTATQTLVFNVTAQGLTAPTSAGTNIQGGASGNVITGNDGNDVLYGGYLGSDIIYGMGGNDIIYADQNAVGSGGFHDDIIYGGAGNDIIYADYHDMNIRNQGGNDIIYGDEGNDIIYAMGGNDLVYGGDDNDTIYGHAGDDILHGDDGDDILYGEYDNDILYGGNGNDILYGGEGADILYGGAGADVFAYASHAESRDALMHDVIKDFEAGIDKIRVGIFNDIVNGAGLASGRTLEWYQTGTGPTAKTIITSDQITYKFYLELEGHINLTINDFDFYGTVGTNGNDTLVGTTGNDSILGLDGDDIINARQGGFDQVYGGGGNDTITLGSEGIGYGEDGNDTIYLYDKGIAYGGNGNDVIYGWRNSVAYGGAGHDTFIIDNPRLVSTDPNYAFTIMDFDVTTDKLDMRHLAYNGYYFGARDYGRQTELYIYYDAVTDSTYIVSQDHVEWWPFAITLKGNYATNADPAQNLSAANFIFAPITDGGPGDTDSRPGYIAGSSANEGIIGTNGNDVIYAGTNDHVNSLNGNDIIIARNAHEVSIDAGLGDNRIFLVGQGSAFLNTYILGNNSVIATGSVHVHIAHQSGGNDFLKGAASGDVLSGGDGHDVIYGGRGNDVYMRGGHGNDYLHGGEGDETHIFDGGAGNDILIGGYGQDYMWGGWYLGASEGNDTFIIYDPLESKAEAPDVIMDFGAGDKLVLHGFTGIGTGATELTVTYYVETKHGFISAHWADIENAATGFKITLKTTETITAGGNLVLNPGMLGTQGNDVLSGTSGADAIFGMKGNDTIYGGDGNDIIYGGEGADTLFGGAGDDELWGGWANDILVGGAGIDRLEGGSGNDIFRFGIGDSVLGAADVIWDFKEGGDLDKIDISAIDIHNILTFDDIIVETPDMIGGVNTRISVTAHGYNFSVELVGYYEKGIDIVATDFIF